MDKWVPIFLLMALFMGISYFIGTQNSIHKRKVQDAYLKGIAAKELPFPYELKSNTVYVIQTFYNTEDSTVVSIVYPGLE